jgi:nitrite reductase (NADH) large subunit
LVGPGLEQAAVLAHHLNGQPARYTGSLTATRLKVVKHAVFSMGIIAESDDPAWLRSKIYRDSVTGVYRKLVLRRGRMVGAIALGDWDELPRVQEAVNSGRVVMPWELWRFTKQGCLWPESAQQGVQDWPASAIVCNCTGVTRGDLTAAMSQGRCSIEQLIKTTGASSVCGSCRPLLSALTGAKAVPADMTGVRALAITSLLALPILLAMSIPTEFLRTDSVQTILYQLSVVWRDGFWKQVTGFTLLGLGLIGLAMSLRKRVASMKWGSFVSWRFLHVSLGALALVALLLHTGLEFGAGLNSWLLTNYLALALAGIVAALATAYAAPELSRSARQMQRWANRAHLFIGWPLPALLGFHVLSVYYF